MISADFSKVTPQADQPRVRPSIWLLMLVVGGVGLLALGHSHNWFLAAFVTGTLHNLTFFLAWALVGLAYSMLASLVWLRWGGEPGRVNRVVGLLFLVGSIMWGSQEVAHLVMDKLGVPIVQIGWDPDSQEFVVDVISTNNAVVGARMRGDMQTIVSVEGLWWSPSEKETSQPLLASEVEEFAVGAPALLGHRQGTPGADQWFEGMPWQVETIRLPWKPRVVESHRAYVIWVNAAWVNRMGKRVGGVSSFQVLRGWYYPTVWSPIDPRAARRAAFFTEAWAWITDPERNQAPFQVRPPPLPGVVRDDIRLVPVK